eukprot:COSAG01_NODE_64499_length_276_cov_0.790960_1_plen_64_part_01
MFSCAHQLDALGLPKLGLVLLRARPTADRELRLALRLRLHPASIAQPAMPGRCSHVRINRYGLV